MKKSKQNNPDVKIVILCGFSVGIADKVLGAPVLKRHREDLASQEKPW